jgi:ABC-2 type transport system permease protein
VTAAAPGASRPAAQGTGKPMGLWRLEWLRLARTPRALSLGAVYVAFGLIEPVITKYQSTIFSHLGGGGVQIKFPAVTPAAGIASYVNEISSIGLIVVVVIAAGALTLDSRQGLAIFLRTRVSAGWQLVIPRFAVNAAAAAVAYLLGTLAAWYETKLLIGSLPAGEVLAGVAFGALYLAFAVAVTAFAASVARGTLAAVGITLAALLLLPIAGTVRAVHDWLPSSLVNAPADLLTGAPISHYLPAASTAAAASVALLILAVVRLRNREV